MALPDASFLEEEGHQGHLYEGIVNLYWNISRGATEAIVLYCLCEIRGPHDLISV